MRSYLVSEAKRLNADVSSGRPAFEVGDSPDRKAVFLFRRCSLKDFVQCEDQASAVLEFFDESHRIADRAVLRIHEQLRQSTTGAGQLDRE